MSDSSSDLSSAPSDDELDLQLKKKDGILKFFSKAPKPNTKVNVEIPPPRKKREPSPEHVFCLADNQDIAFIVMFRSRFTEAFPKSLANFGPQELETDIVDSPPGERVEHLLCALLGLLLNRKQDVKAGHYNRALEEAIQTHKSQWAKGWESKNPLSGGATFGSMLPTERLTLLRTLILWSLSSSDVVKAMITASYKQNRHEDDLNQPLSVQPWGSDRDKRRYYLIEGLDDTHFRVYRESQHFSNKRTWWSVAGDIEELKALAEKLEKEDGGHNARLLSGKMLAAVPRFEATEEKRKRREYRQVRKQQFKRPEPGFSMYEGRTRGKRIKYTYSDEEGDIYSDSNSTTNRRSTRNTRNHTPIEQAGPTITQSGRQVKARQGGTYGESILSGRQTPALSVEMSDEHEGSNNGRPKRAAAARSKPRGGKHIPGYNDVDEMTSDEEGDASEQDYGDDEEEDVVSLASDAEEPDEEEEEDDDDEMEGVEVEKKSLIVKLPITTPTPEPASLAPPTTSSATTTNSTQATTSTKEDTPLSGNSTAQQAKSQPVNTASKPVDIPVMSPSVPTSPLAFRGSPGKPTPFANPVNVGYQGS